MISFKDLEIVAEVDQKQINDNYLRIKKDVHGIIENEMDRMMNTPGLEDLVIKK